MEREGQIFKDWMSFWSDRQREFLDFWSAAAGQAAVAGAWRGGTPFDMFRDWQRTWTKTFLEPLGARPPAAGLGSDVLRRMVEASGAYADLVNVWARSMTVLSQLPVGTTLSTDKVRQLYDEWVKDYQTMMESLWGAAPSESVRETAKAQSDLAGTWAEYAWRVMEPILSNLEQMPQMLTRMARGEVGATAELTGVLQKNYELTLGRFLRAPTLGFFRELSERANKAVDAYVRFNTALAEYFVPFHQTGLRAGERVFQRLMEFRGQEVTPETLREFYRIWWTINEDVYHDMFQSEEFTKLLGEVVRAGLLFRKQFDELSDEIVGLTNLPTKAEMDEIYRSIYELKKEVRQQRRTIQELERRLGVRGLEMSPMGSDGA